MDFNRKAHPDCVYADNPFHECASACLERIAQGHIKKTTKKKQTSKILSFSSSFGRKKKDSYSKPNSSFPAKTYQNGGGGFVNAISPKTVTATNKSFSSSSSGDPEEFFNHKPEKKLTQTFHVSSNNLVDPSKVESPEPGNQVHNGKTGAGDETRIFNFLSPPRSNDNDDEDNNEIGVELDLESVMSDTFVTIGKYKVRSGSSKILSTIIEKHGDIALNCKLESDSMKSRYLECLCSLMQELKSTPVGKLTKVKVKEMLAVLKDLESVNIEVDWLRSVLEEFARFQEDVESEREKQESVVKAKREELEAREVSLVKMEEEIEEMRAQVVEMEKLRMEKIGFKIEKFKGKSFIDELL